MAVTQSELKLSNSPLTANEKILDALIRHQVYLMRFAGGERNVSARKLEQTERKLRLIIMDYAERFSDISSYSAQARNLYKRLTREIEKLRYGAWTEIIKDVTTNFRELAQIEQERTSSLIAGYLPVIVTFGLSTTNELDKMVSNLPIRGSTLSELLDKAQRADSLRIVERFKEGIADNLSIADIVATVMGTKDLKFKDGVTRKAFNSLGSILRTGSNAIGGFARRMFYERNEQFKRELFVAVLDSRTTFKCANLDGDTYLIGEGPQPPLHWNCRSNRVPYVAVNSVINNPIKPEIETEFLYRFSKQNNLSGINKVEDLPNAYKRAYNAWAKKELRSLIGGEPLEVTFKTWFTRQSVQFQKDYLGPARYKLYKEGRIKFSDLVSRDGYTLTVRELNEKFA